MRSIAFPYYLHIKNKYCISYSGFAPEYLLQLRLLRPIIEQQFAGLQVYLSCRDELFEEYLAGYERVLTANEVLKGDIGYVRQIATDLSSGQHPIMESLQESEIENCIVCQESSSSTRLCVICPSGVFPTISLTAGQIEKCKSIAMNAGFHASVGGDVNSAGWVIGVENTALFEAASRGVRTTLFLTGVGGKLYKAMFPRGEILKV